MTSEITNEQALQRLLVELPPKRLKALLNFAVYLKDRFSDPEDVDFSWDWSEEDMRDLAMASLRHFDEGEAESRECPDATP